MSTVLFRPRRSCFGRQGKRYEVGRERAKESGDARAGQRRRELGGRSHPSKVEAQGVLTGWLEVWGCHTETRSANAYWAKCNWRLPGDCWSLWTRNTGCHFSKLQRLPAIKPLATGASAPNPQGAPGGEFMREKNRMLALDS